MILINNRLLKTNSHLHIYDADGFMKIISFLIVICSIILTSSVAGYISDLIFLISISYFAGTGLIGFLSGMRKMWLFFITIFIMNAVFFGESDPLWSFSIISITEEGIIRGAHVVSRVLLVAGAGNIFTHITSPQAMTKGFSQLLSPLKFLRIPADDIALILSVSVQFIPVFTRESEIIRRAQIARGAGFENKNIFRQAYSYLPLIIPIFISAFRKADELATAMEARGFRKNTIHRKKLKLQFSISEFIIIFPAVLLFIIQVLIF